MAPFTKLAEGRTHVEASQGLAVRVELVVVELDELLYWRGLMLGTQAW